uniref:Nucleoside-diphosphate kinase n=1 Tax=Paramoeba aestuarina TaxID=180227 RepID=A0A7S4NJ90_9EUKA|mmetsp:Transcript_1693/g.2585  ORF Transcript_1693/g.2585 Transcript_1693/m.2585 type:complete len:153 (+) Transcript_1693:243-701(+)
MREKYTKQDAQIHYFVVEFDPDELSWKDFRGKVIGATDPSVAHPESLRGVLYRNWKDLGIESQPDISDNGVHGSAGPLAALRERTVWLGTKPHEDPFGATLTSHGVQRLEGWMMNPIVRLSREGNMMKGPCFDLTEDMDSDDVVGALTREYT